MSFGYFIILILMLICVCLCVCLVMPRSSQPTIDPFQSVWTDVKKQAAVGLLEHLHRKTNRYFLAYGTLLGYARHDGHIIPWDDDLDVGMHEKDFARVRDQLNTDEVELVQFRKYAYKIHYRKNKKIKHHAWSWPWIDIFIFTEDPATSKLFCPSSDGARYPKDLVFPLRYGMFESTQAVVPNDPRGVLDIQYGDDWKSTCDSGQYHHENENKKQRRVVDCAQLLQAQPQIYI